jgi:hypothetical protein
MFTNYRLYRYKVGLFLALLLTVVIHVGAQEECHNERVTVGAGKTGDPFKLGKDFPVSFVLPKCILPADKYGPQLTMFWEADHTENNSAPETVYFPNTTDKALKSYAPWDQWRYQRVYYYLNNFAPPPGLPSAIEVTIYANMTYETYDTTHGLTYVELGTPMAQVIGDNFLHDDVSYQNWNDIQQDKWWSPDEGKRSYPTVYRQIILHMVDSQGKDGWHVFRIIATGTGTVYTLSAFLNGNTPGTGGCPKPGDHMCRAHDLDALFDSVKIGN